MNEQKFQFNLSGGKTFQQLDCSPGAPYWSGYCRGLRRHYFGERYGTPEEHEQLLRGADDTRDRDKFLYYTGYRVGFGGIELEEAIGIAQQAADKQQI